jgi:transcription termination/antitermination protein NusA
MDLKTLRRAIDQIAEEKGIDPKKILEAIESSIAAAYKKEYEKKGEIIRAKFDIKTGAHKFWQIKTVVDETTVRIPDEETDVTSPVTEGENEAPLSRGKEQSFGDDEQLLPRYNPDRHILLADAKKKKKDAALGDEIEYPLEPQEDFGRIAAQTAKQVILQKLRDAERESVLEEFKNREGEIISGIVQRFDRGNVTVELGRATGILFQTETVPGEHYKPGDRMKFYVLAIQEESRIPGIILSRAHPKFVSQLFALEVPEIGDGTVEIKAIAREPGNRTKIAVHSGTEGVDPVGACVGQRGTRVMAVSNELGQEKVDIIEWSEDPAKFIASALSPAEVKNVEILPRREARVFINEDQLSLAIGKGGQNVRLAARLTGWKIDVRSTAKPEEVQAEGVAELTSNNETLKSQEGVVKNDTAENKPPEPQTSSE